MDAPGGRGRRVIGRLLAGAAIASCAAWLAAPWSYWLDVAAAYQHLLVVLGLALGAACWLLGRRAAAGVCVAGVLLGLWPLLAGRAWSRPPVDLASPPGPGLTRVVSFNIGPENPLWREDLGRVLGWHADVVILIEVPVALNRGINRGRLEEIAGWHWEHRRWVDEIASPCFVLTRRPLERADMSDVVYGERDILLAAAGDRLLVSVAHPHSPRTPGRWRLGNEIWDRTAWALASRRVESGLPLVVGADLNGGPAGSRAWTARRSGLRMAKPLLGGWGSFPVSWAGPMRVQLDDVWVSRGVSVRAWSSVTPLGSDHRAVVVDLALP